MYHYPTIKITFKKYKHSNNSFQKVLSVVRTDYGCLRDRPGTIQQIKYPSSGKPIEKGNSEISVMMKE